MRGPEARVYTGYDGIAAAQAGGPGELSGARSGGVGCRELEHNVRLYVDQATTDVRQLAAKAQKEEKHRAALSAEEEKLGSRVKQEEQHIRRLGEVRQALCSS
jgi:hypothetical protein